MTATVSGPMFWGADLGDWASSHRKSGGHYNNYALKDDERGMAALRDLFPDAQANEMNFCLFSTAGVHGTYNTIEECEAQVANPVIEEGDDEPWRPCVTFLVVLPRIVTTFHGNCYPQGAADFDFLKKLRASSWEAVAKIGRSA